MTARPARRKLTLTAVQTRPTSGKAQNSVGFRRAPVAVYARSPAPFFPRHGRGQADSKSLSARSSESSSHSRFQRHGWPLAPTPMSAIETELFILWANFRDSAFLSTRKPGILLRLATVATTNSSPRCAGRSAHARLALTEVADHLTLARVGLIRAILSHPRPPLPRQGRARPSPRAHPKARLRAPQR
jgi:hypothetical protein